MLDRPSVTPWGSSRPDPRADGPERRDRVRARRRSRQERVPAVHNHPRPLYRLYAGRLAREIRSQPVAGHVGVILDGNRRYARERRLADPGLAYGRGAEKLDHVRAWCAELGNPTLSLWVLSTENLRRPPRELSGICAAIETKLTRLAEDRRCDS